MSFFHKIRPVDLSIYSFSWLQKESKVEVTVKFWVYADAVDYFLGVIIEKLIFDYSIEQD